MNAVRAHRFGNGLVVDRGAEVPLLLLGAGARAEWEALDAGRTVRAAPEVLAARHPARSEVLSSKAAPRPYWAWRPVTRSYGLAGKAVALDCADAELAALVHPRLAHCETRDPAVARLRLRRTSAGFVLLEAGRTPEAHDRVEALIGAVMRRLVEIGRGETDWCAVLHAAAVTDGLGGAIILPGSCGRGKSTLTAALLAQGADYLSDDCVPLDSRGRAVPVPYGICVKQSGWEVAEALLPESVRAPVFVCDERGPCRYVPPRRVASGALPLAAIVFPDFAHGRRLTIEPVGPEEALAALVDGRAWLAREEGLSTALGVIEKTPVWRLSYGTTEAALEAMGDLRSMRHAAE